MMKKLLVLAACVFAVAGTPAQREPAITHVLFVTMDGMRWQEVFGGMAAELLTKTEATLKSVDASKKAREIEEASKNAGAPKL